MKNYYAFLKIKSIQPFLMAGIFAFSLLSASISYGQGGEDPPFSLGINCGSDTDYTAGDGTVYVADVYGTGGNAGNTFTGPLYTNDILGTEDDVLYQTYYKTGYTELDDFFYNIPLTSGKYNVTLKFCDYQQWQRNAGHLIIEGTQLLTNYVVQDEAGGPFTAHDLTFTINVEDGELNMQFINDEVSVGDFFINGILIEEDVPFNLGINCGSDTDYTAVDGTVYVADVYGTGGNAGNTFTGPLYTNDILGTEDDVLYQTYYKTGYTELDDFFYNIPVGDGTYNVTLKFADYQQWQRNAGHLIIEGTQLLTNYVVQDEAGGPFTAHDLTFTVIVEDGELNMQFINDEVSVGDFFINGILIEEDVPYSLGINCGSDTDYTAVDGKVYVADVYGTGGSAGNTFTGPLYTGDILGTEDDVLYQTYYKTGYTELADHFYNIPLDNGTYDVTLKFCDYQQWQRNAGHLIIEGTQLLTSYVVQDEAGGPFTAHDLTFTIKVEDGELNMQFINDEVSVGDFFINGIYIQELTEIFYSLDAIAEFGTITMDPVGGSYTSGTEVTVSVETEYGYNFLEWTGDIEGIADVTATTITVLMDKAKSITATFEALTLYTLTTDAVNGTIAKDADRDSYISGTEVTLTAEPDYGYEFVEWTGDLEGIGDATASTITVLMDKDKSITATFQALTMFTLTTNVTNGSVYLNPLPDSVGGRYFEGAEVRLSAKPNVGYIFNSWSGDLSGNENPTTIVMDKDMNVTAEMLLNIFPLSIDATNGLVSVFPASPSGEYDAGTDLVLQAIPEDGYRFLGWEGDLSGNQNPTAVTMDSAIHLVALFELIPESYTLTTAATNGSVSLDPAPAGDGTYEDGTEVTVTAIPDEGYEFSAWSGDLTGTDNPATITIDGNKSITAQFDVIISTGKHYGIEESNLAQNYPNPFSVRTIIPYQIDKAATVQLTIYNILGEKVNTLVNTYQNPGSYEVEWNVVDANGTRLSNGVYFYRLEVDAKLVKTQKAIISQ